MIRRILPILLLAAGIAAAEGRMILLIGPPGSGKSTQSAFLQKKYGLGVIAVDDLIKDNPQEFNKRKATGVDNIEPHSDPILNKLVKNKLTSVDLSKGIVLDGYPATKDHSDYLLGLMKETNLPPAIIIWLDVPDEVVRKRLTKRNAPGDTPQKIEERLKDFHREMDLIQVYFPNAKINKVDATKKPAKVSKLIQEILTKG
jgi:adenylate kinase